MSPDQQAAEGDNRPDQTCPLCNGNGQRPVNTGGPDGEEYVPCENCDGTGLVDDPEEPTPLDTVEQAVMNGAMLLVAQIYSQACDVCGRPTYGNHEGQHLADAVVCEDCCKRLESRKNR